MAFPAFSPPRKTCPSYFKIFDFSIFLFFPSPFIENFRFNYLREIWFCNEFLKQAIKFSEVVLKRTATGPRAYFIHFQSKFMVYLRPRFLTLFEMGFIFRDLDTIFQKYISH